MEKENIVYRMLLDSKIAEECADNLMNRVYRKHTKHISNKQLLEEIKAEIMNDFISSEQDQSNIKVIFFVGPTGAGKTTTLAKRASNLSLDMKKGIAIISADTYKVGAQEALMRYSDIIEAPFAVLDYDDNNPRKMSKNLKSFISEKIDLEYILVDTRACSRKDEDWMDYFSRVYGAFSGYDRKISLILPATGRDQDLIDITALFSSRYDYSLIFTKLDEASSYGVIYNLHQSTGKTIDYITEGQEVPTDIAPFDPDKMIEKMLEDTRITNLICE